MNRYRNLKGKSGISYYQINEHSIEIKFGRNPVIYVYSYFPTGETHIKNMISLAIRGWGLNSYIKKNSWVKNHFTTKSSF